MLTKIKLALAVSGALFAGAAGVVAAQPAPAKGDVVKKWDADGDGKLDAKERADRKKDRLAKWDTNHDGKLDATERAAMRDAKLTERFTKMDANHDGQVSLAEFKAFNEAQPRHARGGHRHRGGKARTK